MKWVKGIVIDQKQWTPTLYSLYVQAPGIEFIAGQFTQLTLDPTQPLLRAYSFVNPPSQECLEFYYTVLPQGAQTPKLVRLKKNDPVWLNAKGSGRLTLQGIQSAQTLWLIATGTGVGPYLSILSTNDVWQKFEKVVLVQSVRYLSELTHQTLIAALQLNYPHHFCWCPIVTRESSRYLSQRIPPLLQSGQLEGYIKSDVNEQSIVMLCGNPHMVRDVLELCQKRGLSRRHAGDSGQILIENYWKE